MTEVLKFDFEFDYNFNLNFFGFKVLPLNVLKLNAYIIYLMHSLIIILVTLIIIILNKFVKYLLIHLYHVVSFTYI